MNKYFASCPVGLEEVLKNEIVKCNINKANIERGGVSFQSSEIKALELILRSGVVSRVFLYLTDFKIKDEKDLYNEAMKIKWSNYFKCNQSFKINTILQNAVKETFKNSLYLSQLLKDAVVDTFKKIDGKRPDVEKIDPDYPFLMRLTEDENFTRVNIYLDLCGQPLGQRGYRKGHHPAPLQESLANGLVQLTDFNKDDVFIDLMCGSGTLLIEAILVREGITPSFMKIKSYLEKNHKPWRFLYQNWYLNNTELQDQFNGLVDKTFIQNKKAIENIPAQKFYGVDIDASSVQLTSENLANAGLPRRSVVLHQGDSTKLSVPATPPGVVMCNPPYGERLDDLEGEDLAALYYNLGENLKTQFKGMRAYVFTGNLPLRKKISLQTSKRIPLHNGPLECRLFRYELF
jgi:23S rRNA G2445 N2-methylase RlmL